MKGRCWIVSIGPVRARPGVAPLSHSYVVRVADGYRLVADTGAAGPLAVQAALAAFRRDYPHADDVRGNVSVLEGTG